ncbi:BtrH N-terminal domain-containing protein [Aureivirga marina]|uniref:BtrH N-terminal domain-containing protein n=1 Tax=Aureivirga marina TaxID=1182451 RepID=UPI0018CAF309|nr:BtrH N-terminal domain-containing protein [Aureivirga marina]
MKLKIKAFEGQHCETTATGTLLNQLGIELSEPMLFGLGEGFAYGFMSFKGMNFPFIGGRIRSDFITKNLCKNLDLHLEIKETTSIKKAWKNVETALNEGKVVGLKLDCYHLDYFTRKIHFAAHYAAIYGFDEKDAFLVDTKRQGGSSVKTSLKNLELARNERGPLSSRNLSYTIEKKGKIPEVKTIINEAVLRNIKEYLNPPIRNFGYKGIFKTSEEVKKWFERTKTIESDFETSASIMENGGTGGSLFRNIYRDFLKEAYEITGNKAYLEASKSFVEIAILWKEISELFLKIAKTKEKKYVEKASELFLEIGEKEQQTMEKLFLDLSKK